MSKIDQISDKNTTWCFQSEPAVAFDKRLFDIEWVQQQGLVSGTPNAGRGNAHFLKVDGFDLVLREYLRGGLVRHVNTRHYLWQGLQQTRAYRELHMLAKCVSKGLPAPVGYGCKIQRDGLFYTASLITHKLDGVTFAERLSTDAVSSDAWAAVGGTIALFHNAGIWHADLNAHNILITQAGAVSLIDFDRALEYLPAKLPAQSNVQRLHRSLLKEAGKSGYEFNASGWAALLGSYEDAVSFK